MVINYYTVIYILDDKINLSDKWQQIIVKNS